MLDQAGLTDMTQVLRDAGYQAMGTKKTRYVILDLVKVPPRAYDKNYFTMGANPVGRPYNTPALLVPSEQFAFKLLVDLLKVRK